MVLGLEVVFGVAWRLALEAYNNRIPACSGTREGVVCIPLPGSGLSKLLNLGGDELEGCYWRWITTNSGSVRPEAEKGSSQAAPWDICPIATSRIFDASYLCA